MVVLDFRKFLGTQNKTFKSCCLFITSTSEPIFQENYLAFFSNSSSLNWSGKLNLCSHCSYPRDSFNWISVWCVFSSVDTLRNIWKIHKTIVSRACKLVQSYLAWIISHYKIYLEIIFSILYSLSLADSFKMIFGPILTVASLQNHNVAERPMT